MSKTKIKHEKLFRYFSAEFAARPSEIGRRQFAAHQSSGTRPLHPSAYYLALEHGKRMFDWMSTEVRLMWGTWEWPGWWLLRQDWLNRLWILAHLLRWHSSVPPWVTTEDAT